MALVLGIVFGSLAIAGVLVVGKLVFTAWQAQELLEQAKRLDDIEQRLDTVTDLVVHSELLDTAAFEKRLRLGR